MTSIPAIRRYFRIPLRVLARVAIALLAGASLLVSSGAAFALAFQGLEPGGVTRQQVERVLGAPSEAIRPTLLKYPGRAAGVRDVIVDYDNNGTALRFDVDFTTPVERAAVLRALRIASGSDAFERKGNSAAEYFGSAGITLTYQRPDPASGVTTVSYGSPTAVARRVAELHTPPPPRVGGGGVGSLQPCSNPNGSDNCTFTTGTNLDYFQSPSAGACQAACNQDGRCTGWTFIRPGAYNAGDPSMCYRMSATGNLAQHRCCISGWRSGPAIGGGGRSGGVAIGGGGTPPSLPPPRVTMEPNVDRPGSDYNNFALQVANPEACRLICERDDRCHAYTYVNPGLQGPQARCWLKTSAPAAHANNCCVSGVKH